jgi:hypothetical protein
VAGRLPPANRFEISASTVLTRNRTLPSAERGAHELRRMRLPFNQSIPLRGVCSMRLFGVTIGSQGWTTQSAALASAAKSGSGALSLHASVQPP